jgi:type I restriction enzyme S subunit
MANALPPGWTKVRVDQAGAVRLGRQRSPDQATGAYPTKYVRAANITPAGLDLSDLLEMNFTPAEREVFGLRLGDVLLTEASGSSSQVGRAAIWRGDVEPCCYQNTVIRFRPHLTTSEYALLVFRHFAAAGVFAGAARGVGIQHLGASRFAELQFPLPPLAEQVRIVETADRRLAEIREARDRLQSALGHLDEQIREVLAAAVLGELVVQSAEQAPDADTTSNRSSTQRDLFEGSQREWTALTDFNWDLPAGWAWRRVDEVGVSILGRQRSPQHERGSHMRPYLRVANVLEDRIDFTDLKTMNFSPEEAEVYRLQSGDVLLNEGQSPELVGRPALYRGEIGELYFQNHLIRFRANKGIVPEFALLVFRHYMHTGVFRQISRWSTNIANMGLARFKSLPFPVPPLEEQERIVAEARRRLDATAAQISAVRASFDRLPDLEQELLAAAVAGDLVPQNPDDEPASVLLLRLGPARRDAEEASKPRHRGERMPNKRSRPTQQAEPTPDLAAVLRQNGGKLALPELFSQAGYDRDLPEHVELFYLALRDALGRTIRLSGDATENAELEAADAT